MRTREETLQRFEKLVNMTAEQLREWLADRRSRMAGTGEGLDSGRRLVGMLERGAERWTPGEWHHAERVVGFIARHLRSEYLFGDERNLSGWSKRHISLRNWGHDPSGSPADERWLADHPGASARRRAII
jgi:hypothetical protein